MADTVLKRLQVGSEGPFTSGATIIPTGSSSVYGTGAAVIASKRLAVEDATEFGYQDLVWEAPEEARGSYAANYVHLLQMRMAKGKFSALMYPDDMVWWMRAAVSGSPTITTLPGTPQSVLAAVSIATSTAVSLTGITQPNAQADVTGNGAGAKTLLLVYVSATNPTTAVTFTIAGTDVNGAVLNEVVNFGSGAQTLTAVPGGGGGGGATTCTLHTVGAFATITSITASVTVAAATIQVQCVNGWLYKFTPDLATSTLYSLTGEFFDGSTGWRLPGLIVPKLDFDIEVGKSVKIKGDCLAKDMVNQTLASIADAVLPAASSYATRYYSDPIGTAPGTTQVSARFLKGTLGIENQLELGKAADGTPAPNFVGRKRYKTKAEWTLLFNNGIVGSEDPADFNAFQATYKSRTIMVALPSTGYLPCGPLNGATLAASGWPTQLGDTQGTSRGGLYGVTIAHAGKFTAAAPVAVNARLAVKLTHEGEVDLLAMNAPYAVQLVSRVGPNTL